MTVLTDLNRKEYAGNDVTTAFSTSPVVFFDVGDLDVYLVTNATGVAVLQTITTHYTVAGGAGLVGTVTMLTAPTSLQTLVIVRDVGITQGTDLVNNDISDAEVVEDALDRLTMIAQQNAAGIDRSFKLSDSDISGASTELPTPAANTLIGWNAAANGLENFASGDLPGLVVLSPFMVTVLDDTTAAAARATLRASPSINVKDYAIGDGVANDTVGLNAALVAGAGGETSPLTA